MAFIHWLRALVANLVGLMTTLSLNIITPSCKHGMGQGRVEALVPAPRERQILEIGKWRATTAEQSELRSGIVDFSALKIEEAKPRFNQHDHVFKPSPEVAVAQILSRDARHSVKHA
jgi:hypothetical protein